jgi:hypothetical protein
MKDKIAVAISKSIKPVTSKSEVQRRVKGNRAMVLKAIDEMIEQGELEVVNKEYRLPVPDRSENVQETGEPVQPFHRSRPIGAERVTGTVLDAENANA